MNIQVVGIGPGDKENMTARAAAALEQAQVIVGYEGYIALLAEHFPGKTFVSSKMRGETERCKRALELAQEGTRVAVVSSGDAGVYGMAGLILELSVDYPGISVEVIPGVTAACAGGAVLGAPLTHDFAVISLSDLLTDWGVIEKRLAAAAESDFVICLYNPGSQKRKDYLQRACDVILLHRDPQTPTGLVRNIGRAGEQAQLVSLKALRDTQVDMFTTVFIGNSATRVIGGRLVTPRGYPHG